MAFTIALRMPVIGCTLSSLTTLNLTLAVVVTASPGFTLASAGAGAGGTVTQGSITGSLCLTSSSDHTHTQHVT